MTTIDIIGKGTSIAANIDAFLTLSPDVLSKLNTEAQGAAALAGLFSTVNPGTTISLALGTAIGECIKCLLLASHSWILPSSVSWYLVIATFI
ncbi:hypothetical protein [Beijerinckia indica]|uniref:hypothetical protein n=1 Tax=Beijerinckia indica TaxID=533 RepID=UPI0011D0DC42|nr:hypothetical protein [Beijerinckia indica]